jgi:hypothetical protein
MSESERDQLIMQLSEAESAAERRQAAKRLGDLRDPAAIDALVNAYLDENEDESVRRAAEQALRIYRRIQQERAAAENPLAAALEEAPKSPQRLLKPLAISLAVLIALNLLLVIIRGLSGARPIELIAVQPTPVLATSRAALIIEAQNYLDALSAEVTAFRQPLLDLQANVEVLRRLPRCGNLPESRVAPRALLPEDARTQPDLASIFDTLNAVLSRFRALRALHAEICAQTDLAVIDQRLQPEGGPAGLVAQLDTLLNSQIGAARLALEAARAITPTPPVTLAANAPPTPTPLPPTPTPLTPDATAPFGAPIITEAPPFMPTAAVVMPTVPPIANITYQGVRLAERTRFRYRLTADYEAITPQNRTARGALSLRVLAENSPTPMGRFEIGLRDDPEVGAFRDWLPERFYQQGNAFYTALNGVFYHTGVGLPPQTLCAAEPFSPANIGALATLNVDALIGRIAPPDLLTTWRVAPPEIGKPQYRAEFVTQDAEGVQISFVATLVLALDGSIEQLTVRETRRPPPNYAKTLFRERTISYTLQAADAMINLSEVAQLLEPPCRNVTPNAP